MRIAVLALAVWSLAAPGIADPPVDLSGSRLVDLTHPFDEKTIYWPTSPSSFQLNRLAFGKTEGDYFYASNAFCTLEHGGTHLDARSISRRGGGRWSRSLWSNSWRYRGGLPRGLAG